MRWGRPRRRCHGGVERVVLPADDGRGGRQRVGVELLDGELLVAAEDLHLEALGAAHLAVLLLLRRQLLPLRLPVRWQLQRGNLKLGQVIILSWDEYDARYL